MEEATRAQVVSLLPAINAAAPVMREERRRLQEVHEQAQLIGSGDEQSDRQHSGNRIATPGGFPKVGRNDPCPCGAKKPDGTPIKYKHHHGKNL